MRRGCGEANERKWPVCHDHNAPAVCVSQSSPVNPDPLNDTWPHTRGANDYQTLSSPSSESNIPPPASGGGAPNAVCTAIVSGSASALVLSNPSTSRSERLENPRPCARSSSQTDWHDQHMTLCPNVTRKHDAGSRGDSSSDDIGFSTRVFR